MFKRKLILFVLSVVSSLGVQAQWHYRVPRYQARMAAGQSDFYRQYIDSLNMLRDSVFSDKFVPSEKSVSTARLFLPLTFYHDVSREAFAPQQSLSPVNKELLDMYLRRPDLVREKESAIDMRGVPEEPNRPLQNRVDYFGQTDRSPVESETAPVTVFLHKPNFWTYMGDYSLQFMQNFVSGNWYKGGESNYSALASITMEANYNNKQKVKWENKLEMRFGLQSTRSDTLHSYKTNEDLFRLTSKLGLQASKKWYYTLQVLAYSQFTHGYKTNNPTLYSDFLAPLNLNVSLGMDYTVEWMNHHMKGNFHIAPLAYNMKYTRLLDLSTRIGIDEGKHFLNDFGSEFTIDLTWQIMEMLQWKTRMYGYTSYERAELEWENTFTFKFNRWISSQLFIYPRFDDGRSRDNHHGYWQFKEYASIGFQYSF